LRDALATEEPAATYRAWLCRWRFGF
jgi:hypothetical protein